VITFFMLAMFCVVGMSIAAVLGFVFFLLKLVFWAVFFPIRLLFKLLWIPVGLAFGALGMLIGLPIILVVGGGVLVFGLIAAVLALLLPLAPLVLFGLLLWAIFRSRPATA
jgi:hypothetical protein